MSSSKPASPSHLSGLTLQGFLHPETGLHMRSLKIDRPLNGLLEAEGATGGGETKDHNHLDFHPLCQTEVSRATGVQSPQHLPGHPSWTILMVLGICNKAGDDRRKLRWKINLPIFKDEDTKDAVTYQSWRWDLTVYRRAGCRDHTLLPYAIRSLQGYPGRLVWSSGTDITLDEVLTILDKHYNNVKALDTLNQELFQMRMADKETVLGWGVHLSQHLQILAASFPDQFPPDHMAELKRDHFYGRLPKRLKVMVAYLKVGPQVSTYSDYHRATREAEKEDTIELSQSPRVPATDGPSKLRATSFFPLRKLKGNPPFTKKPAVCLTQLEEEGTDNGKEPESDNPDGIKGVTKEFMVRLARVVKDAQVDEKHCYHCSSPEHFIHNCLLMKATRVKKQLNGKEGMVMVKGTQTPPKPANATKSPQQEAQEA